MALKYLSLDALRYLVSAYGKVTLLGEYVWYVVTQKRTMSFLRGKRQSTRVRVLAIYLKRYILKSISLNTWCKKTKTIS